MATVVGGWASAEWLMVGLRESEREGVGVQCVHEFKFSKFSIMDLGLTLRENLRARSTNQNARS